ncbi:MAG: hypothetical protein H0V89_07530, partial [Deltaproteobacteria bacterium]|nr:hypothetical protein [Deltaproteobacteria bacterium]
MILLGCAAAWAGSAVVTVEFSADGPRVLSVIPVAGEVAPGPGALEILGVDGRVLARAALEDPRIRSVAVPEGGGETAILDRAIGRYAIDWPAGAHRVRFGGRDALPGGPPPVREGVVAVRYAGPADERLDLLILGDGYTEAELPRFAEDVDALVEYLGGIPPYGRYASLLNIWRTDTASVESGVTHLESGIARETAFGCYYGCGGIDR